MWASGSMNCQGNHTVMQVFDQTNWKEKLSTLHEHAWLKWDAGKHDSRVKLPGQLQPQKPGEIPQHIFDLLEPIVQNMPPKQSYHVPAGNSKLDHKKFKKSKKDKKDKKDKKEKKKNKK